MATKQYKTFLQQTPSFEKILVEAGNVVFRFGLEIGRAMQLKRFHEQRHNALKLWKLSPIDYAAMEKCDACTEARDQMFGPTRTEVAPWFVVRSNDEKSLACSTMPARPTATAGRPDPLILGIGSNLLAGH